MSIDEPLILLIDVIRQIRKCHAMLDIAIPHVLALVVYGLDLSEQLDSVNYVHEVVFEDEARLTYGQLRLFQVLRVLT